MLLSPQEKSQGLVEYALMLVLVASVVIAARWCFGPIIGRMFSNVNSACLILRFHLRDGTLRDR